MAEYSQIRAEIHNWSLESDDRLFRKIELFAQNFLNKVDFVTADVKNTAFSINSNQVELGNAFSKFLNLSNHKFTENKMQPFNDADLLRRSHIESDLIPLSIDANTNIVERYAQALNFGMDNVNITQYLNQMNDDDDRLSVSDAGDQRSYSIYSENSVLPGKNNKLPYIIGTRAFLEDDYIGIYESPEQPIKPEILSFQEISLQESNMKVETNYIPKINPPVPIINQNSKSEASQQNNNNVPNPPLLLNNGIFVNQSAPPPPSPPNLLLPLLLPSLKNNTSPLNQNPPKNISPPPNQQGDSKILAPKPFEDPQNQNKMQQFPNQMGMQPFPNQGMPMQNQGMNINNTMTDPQNYQSQPQNYQNYQNDQNNQNNFAPQIPTNKNNVNVNIKAPPPPNLKALIDNEKKKQNTSPPIQQSTQKIQSFVQQPISNAIPVITQVGLGNNLQEQLMAQINKKKQQASQPNYEQNASFQPQQNQMPQPHYIQQPQNENSQFRQSLKALQENQDNQEQTFYDEKVNLRANLKQQLERALKSKVGNNANPNSNSNPMTQNQTDDPAISSKVTNENLSVSAGRTSLKVSKSVDVEKLENLYKPAKKKKGNGLFDDNENKSDDSGSDKDNIFGKSEKKKNSKFDDIFSKPVIVEPKEEVKIQKTEKKNDFLKPQIMEPEENIFIEPTENKNISTFNAKKIEDSFKLTKSNDILLNKEDLLQKTKVQEFDKKDKFSKLFANDSDEDDEYKKTEKMKQMYAQEAKLKKSVTALPQKKTKQIESFFQDKDSNEEETIFPSKTIAKPILKEKKTNENEEEPENVPVVKKGLEKKGSVRFNLDQDEEPESNENQQKPIEKLKKNLLFDDDDSSTLKKTPFMVEPPFQKERPFNPLENRPSKKNEENDHIFHKKTSNLFEKPSESLLFGKEKANEKPMEERPSKQPLYYFDAPLQALEIKKPKDPIDKPIESLEREISNSLRPSKPYNFEEPLESFENPISKKTVNSSEKQAIDRLSQKKADFIPEEKPIERLSQRKIPTEDGGLENPSQQKNEADANLQTISSKISAKTITSKIQGLQNKLGNLPLGGMFQKPDDKFIMNPRRGVKKDEDHRPELDHDLLLEKPTMIKKKKPRGKQTQNFQNSENDENLVFERRENAIVQKPSENPIGETAAFLESLQKLENTSLPNSKAKTFEEVENIQNFGTNRSTLGESQPKIPQMPLIKEDSPPKRPLKNLFEDSDELTNNSFKTSNQQNKTIQSQTQAKNPQMPIMEDSSQKKPLKNLLEDFDDFSNSKIRISNHLPKLPDLSNEKIGSKINIEKERPSEKKSKPFESNPLESNAKLPTLPNLFDDKLDKKKKKHTLDRPSEKTTIEEKQKKMFDDKEDEIFSRPTLSKGTASKNNNDVPISPLPSKNDDKAVLPDFKAPSYVAKPGEKESKKLKKLFDDDDDDGGGGFLFKPKTENKSIFGNNISNGGKKKNIFDD